MRLNVTEGALNNQLQHLILSKVLQLVVERAIPLKIQSSLKCKAREKFRRAAYG
jgi:hypothetical protein